MQLVTNKLFRVSDVRSVSRGRRLPHPTLRNLLLFRLAMITEKRGEDRGASVQNLTLSVFYLPRSTRDSYQKSRILSVVSWINQENLSNHCVTRVSLYSALISCKDLSSLTSIYSVHGLSRVQFNSVQVTSSKVIMYYLVIIKSKIIKKRQGKDSSHAVKTEGPSYVTASLVAV